MMTALLWAAGCGFRPSKNTPRWDLLDQIEAALPKIDFFINHFQGLEPLKEADWLPKVGHFFFQSGDTLRWLQEPWVFPLNPLPFSQPYVCYSGKKGEAVLAADFYVGNGPGNKPVFSYDNRIWYRVDGAPDSDLSFVPKVHLSSHRQGRQLTFTLSWALLRGDRPPRSEFSSAGCEVVRLKPDLVFYDSRDPEAIRFWENRVVLIPKGSRLEFRIHAASNFFDFVAFRGNEARFQATQPLHFYRKHFLFSVSFDGTHWGHTLFSFHQTFQSSLKAVDARRIAVTVDASLINTHLPNP